MKDLIAHPVGESRNGALVPVSGPVAVDTFDGRIHVEWDPQAAVMPLGQLPFFTEFLKVSGLFDPWVEDCPLQWSRPNAPKKRDVLATAVLSILAGHRRYAHISALRGEDINAKLLGMSKGQSAKTQCGAALHDGQTPRPLAGESDKNIVTALCAPCSGEAAVRDAALLIPAELSFDRRRHCMPIPVLFPRQREAGLQVLLDEAVKDGVLGAAMGERSGLTSL